MAKKIYSDLDLQGNNLINRGNEPPGGGGANVKAGIELAIAENSARAVVFGTAFAGAPHVVVGFADASAEISIVTASAVTVAGFTINVVKSGGGGSANRDISWIATDAGNP